MKKGVFTSVGALLFLFVVLLFISQVESKKKYYEILNVAENASPKEIKAAFRSLSMEKHPDKNPDPAAHDEFVEISEAYQVLSDPASREKYDRFGEEGLKNNRGGGGFNFNDPFNVFQQFFHQGGGQQGGSYSFNFGTGGGQQQYRRAGQQQQQHQQQQQPQKDEELYMETDSVIILDEENFDDLVINDPESIWLVQFYSKRDEVSREIAADYRKSATQLKGMIKFGAINADEHTTLSNRFKIRGHPTILHFPYGPQKTPKEYKGPKDEKHFSGYAMQSIPSFVTFLRDTNIDNFFDFSSGNFFKVILFTDKNSIPGLFNALSKDYHTRMDFGIVMKNSAPGLADRFQVAEFPEIWVFTGSTENKEKYDGPTKYFSIRRFLYKHLQAHTPPVPGSQAPPQHEFVQITADNSEEICPQTSLCVVSLVKENEVGDLRHMMSNVMEKYMRTKFRFVWMSEENNSGWKNALNLQGSESPKLVVWNPKKNKIVEYDGNFDLQSIANFLDRVLGGDKRWTNVNGKLPSIV